jgi:HD-GYP domain-containing protein (c-di-GMP phosphodiesterase class II)
MHHHERHDGRGYPMGLAGDEIPEFARIIAVADAFDSMTSDRSYRGAKPVEVAVAELRKNAGTQFDPAMVSVFIRALDRTPWQPPRMVGVPPEDVAETTTKDHDDPTMPIEVVSGP